MKTIALASLGLTMMISTAAAARVEFRGGLCILTASAPCTTFEETSVGVCYQMRYAPRNLGDNGPATKVTLIEFGGAQNYTLPSGSLIGTSYQTVNGTGVYRSGFTFTSPMRITAQSPATLTTATSVTITGNIKDFDSIPGCDVKFLGAGPRH